MTRLTDTEANYITVAAASYGLPVNANFFTSYFKVGKKRAKQLENIVATLTPDEVAQVVAAQAKDT